MKANLIAYIPVLNQRHIDWFKVHPNSNLFLITQEMAEKFLPRLSRNIGAVPTDLMVEMIRATRLVHTVTDFAPDYNDPDLGNMAQRTWKDWILPDEDLSHIVAEEILAPAGCRYEFEGIWARYDMTAVKRQTPVMEGIQQTTNHRLRMAIAKAIAPKSPDWWRQIGAALFVGGECVAVAYNNHFPTEYVTDIMGDPRLNVDAGEKGKYVSAHAELTVMLQCAAKGIPTRGAYLYSSVFPCEGCARAMEIAGIDHMFFEEGYSSLDAREVLEGAGVKIVRTVNDPGSA